MANLNIGNLIFLIIVGFLMILMVQRSERKWRWLVALGAIFPVGFLLVRWARLREQTSELWIALGIALALNVIYWIVYGRRHPPGSQGEIRVIGQEDV